MMDSPQFKVSREASLQRENRPHFFGKSIRYSAKYHVYMSVFVKSNFILQNKHEIRCDSVKSVFVYTSVFVK